MSSGISTQDIFAEDRREALDDIHLHGGSRTSHPGTTNSNEIIEEDLQQKLLLTDRLAC